MLDFGELVARLERVDVARVGDHGADSQMQKRVRDDDMPAYVSIRQHTSAYVCIRQHTSACSTYVSVCRHTSAVQSKMQTRVGDDDMPSAAPLASVFVLLY
jgi:sarcosine oxidase delta subunit